VKPKYHRTPKGVQYHESHFEDDAGVEHDIKVGYYCQAEERDTNTPEGIEIDSLTYADGRNAWSDVPESRQDEIAIEIGEYGMEDGY
jgi:hypothetical protein